MTDRPVRRADAVRNRARLLEAGERLVRDSKPIGPDAVAKEAGVGVGTFYRHFPTVGEFAAQLLSADIDKVTDRVGELLAGAAAPEALRRWVMLLAEMFTRKELVNSALRIEVVVGGISPMRLVAALRQILDAGKAAASIRADVEAEALIMVVMGSLMVWTKIGDEDSLPVIVDLIVASTRP